MTISFWSNIHLLITFVLIPILINGSFGYGSNGKDEKANLVVTTPLGSIKGATIQSRQGATIYAFRGIRYAEAPIDELRFQPPVPVKPWKGIYDATMDGPSCPQTFENYTSEDCLLLNVYTLHLPNREKKTNEKRPVMVFFHPGGFFAGTSVSDAFGPHYLLDQDIVLVVPNYRLQSLGFLATGTPEAPGNNGLKDQVQVLRWVQQNIASFSGNPDDVTISGYSAGACSVMLHMVSPMSKGLFHKVISMSGSAYGSLPIPSNLNRLVKRDAELVNCPTEPTEKLVNCLKTKTADELTSHLEGHREFLDEPLWLWQMVIEPDFGQERFLVEHPIKSILNNRIADVPVMIGLTYDEFGGRSHFIVNNKTALRQFNTEYKRIWPIVFGYERDTDFSSKVSEGLRKFYFPDDKIDTSKRQGIADLFADSIIGFGTNRETKLLADNLDNNVYSYRFSYRGKYTFFYVPGSNETVPYGASHHDELLYLFYLSRLTPMFTDGPEAEIVDKMTEMWGNFVKYGSPDTKSKKWIPFDLNSQKFMDIGTNLRTYSFMFKDRYNTWEKLYPLSLYLD